MITKIIEGSDGALYGKWLVGQLDQIELGATTALPGFEGTQRIWTFGGARKFGAHPGARLVLDLQTSQGGVFIPDSKSSADADLDKSKLWVCPLFRQFFCWLYQQDVSDVSALPSFIDLS